MDAGKDGVIIVSMDLRGISSRVLIPSFLYSSRIQGGFAHCGAHSQISSCLVDDYDAAWGLISGDQT